MVVFELMFLHELHTFWFIMIAFYRIIFYLCCILLHLSRYFCCILLHFIAFMFDILVANYPFSIAFYCSCFLTILEGVKIFDCILLQSDCKRCKRAFKVARRLKWSFFRVKLIGMIAKWLHFIAFIFGENCKNVANYCNFFLKNRQNFKFF